MVSIVLTAWLARLSSVSPDIASLLSCIYGALSFETGRCAFGTTASVSPMAWLILGLLTLCVLTQLAETLWWWRRAHRERASGNEHWWLALGGESLSGGSLLSMAGGDRPQMSSSLTEGALDDMPETSQEEAQEDTQDSIRGSARESAREDTQHSVKDEVGQAMRHRRPAMRLCWWWADSRSTIWLAVSAHCVWCSPRLIGLRVTPVGERPRTLWLWPDSGDAQDLHQLRLWLLWPPQPHDMPRQPPALETIRGR